MTLWTLLFENVNIIIRPKPNTKDVGTSTILPTNVRIPAALAAKPTSAEYVALKYLTDYKMIGANSALLRADTQIAVALELSQGITDAVTGIVNRLTVLGKDASGDTPDKSFHPKKK